MRKVNGLLCRLLLTTAFSTALADGVLAETVAETATQWGLIGLWSLDCALPPDHDRGAVLSYEIADSDHVMYRRDFGDSSDEGEVLSARVSGDGMLHLRVYFPSAGQTREYGLIKLSDGSIRAIYNRNKNRYSIKDGKFTSSGKPTPAQQRCARLE